MLFMYWTGNADECPSSVTAWQQLYENFAVYTDDHVIPLLPTGFRSVYEQIRLPAAKSDLARLLLLREHGGLYVDAHVGPTLPSHLLATLDPLFSHNVILFGKGWAMQKETDFDLMNGVLAARRMAPELNIVIDIVINNILDHQVKENNTPGYVPYSLFSLTGTYTIVRAFFDQVAPRPFLKREFENKIAIHYMKDNRSSGFELAAYYTYRRPGNHWSEREKLERFFRDSVCE
jgi:hypothetical protein